MNRRTKHAIVRELETNVGPICAVVMLVIAATLTILWSMPK